MDYYIDPKVASVFVVCRGFGTGQDKTMSYFRIRSYILRKYGYMFLLNWSWGYPGLNFREL